jgi:predicted N-acetyltransferase YhbS
MDITLRPATPADHADVARICFEAFGWIARERNFPPDFPAMAVAEAMAQMALNHPKWFGVVAEVDGRVVGSNFLDQRDAIAAVGPITVDPNVHCKGIGRRLMRAVIDRGRSGGHPGIRLVQEPHNTISLPLYTSLGFDTTEPLALMTGKVAAAAATPPAAGATVRPVTADDVPACAELCKRVHGFDRAADLADAIAHFRPHLLERGGRVVAYASAPAFWIMNHGVGETDADLFDLLAGASAAFAEPLALLVPTRRGHFFRRCLASGLRVVKPMTLMAMGEYHEPRGAFWPSVGY